MGFFVFLLRRLKSHPLFETLVNLRGNPRLCVYTEPLWGIPYYLLAPFIALYMSKLGVSDVQIGVIATVTMVFQMIFSFVSGPITDKFGRRKATFFSDTLSWSIPTLIWAFAQNFWWFLAAALLFSVNMIASNSWQCLLVEEAEQNKLVYIFTWLTICGLVSGFAAPLSGALVRQYTVVPVMRILYLVAFAMMTVKFFVLYIHSSETPQGRIRLEETRGVSLLALCAGCKSVMASMLKNKKTMR
ncbi:MAG: MFS transporter, partial [Oscillospiraceae bacterium]|nr:MFS transporter [Oscillospiraceae bacterium]